MIPHLQLRFPPFVEEGGLGIGYESSAEEERKLTFGLYSAFLACNAIVFKSSLHSRLTVATIFLGVSLSFLS
jgi:hypothetical protein